MASLAESVMGGAQDAVNQQGQTVGNAIQAYHVAATAEHARQELETQKQEADLKKGQFILDGITRANTMTGDLQKNYLSQFAESAKRMDPNIDTSGFQALIKKPEDIQKTLAAYKTMAETGGVQNSDQASYITNSLGLDGAAKLINDHEQHMAMIKAAQMKNEGNMGRVYNGQDMAVLNVVKGVHTNPLLVKVKNQALTLDKGIQTLQPHVAEDGTIKQPTWTDLNEFKQDYSNTLTGGNISSDFKLHELGDPAYKQRTAELEAKFKGNQDQPADPAAIKYWVERGTRLNGKLDHQISTVAQSQGQGLNAQFLHNPNLVPAVQAAIKPYTDGSWRRDPNALEGTDAQLNAPAAQPAPVASPAPAAPAPAPSIPIGTIHNYNGINYHFVGGDVNSPQSWVPNG